MRRNARGGKSRSGVLAALDVGTTKVSCFIARAGEAGIEVAGVGHMGSEGVRGGVILDMDAAEAAVRAAVDAAEQMAGEHIERVAVSLSGGNPSSRRISFDVAVDGHEIGDCDLRRVLDPSWLNAEQPVDRKLVDVIPVSYSIDGTRGIRDPRGMFGERLGVDLHVISSSASAARNLATCISRCHLEVEAEVVAPYASGLGCLVEDEIALGATLIDMGGGTTDVAVFYEGELVHVDSVPVGGQHVTNDIARGLSTTVACAERVKTVHGSAIASSSDDREVIKVPLVGEPDEDAQVPRSMLVGIVQPRIEETFELVRSSLEAAGVARHAGRHIVLAGGASQLTGARETAALVLGTQVRMGRPAGFKGLAEAAQGPAFATCAGLLRFLVDKQGEWPVAPLHAARHVPATPWGRIGHWLRENL